MNCEEFLVELGKTDRGWALWTMPWRPIRRGVQQDPVCPITAVCKQVTGKVYPTVQWPAAAMALNLSEVLAKDIVSAADDNRGRDKGLRQKLLDATGITKPAA